MFSQPSAHETRQEWKRLSPATKMKIWDAISLAARESGPTLPDRFDSFGLSSELRQWLCGETERHRGRVLAERERILRRFQVSGSFVDPLSAFAIAAACTVWMVLSRPAAADSPSWSFVFATLFTLQSWRNTARSCHRWWTGKRAGT